MRFIAGHIGKLQPKKDYPEDRAKHKARWALEHPETPYGYCVCGCGRETKLARRSDPSKGYVRGAPREYIQGHFRRKTGPQYTVVDRGYKSPCWEWNFSRRLEGYGQTSINYGNRLVHRLYYEKEHGTLLPGIHLHHLCENRPCINPAHLLAVTPAQHSQCHPSSNAKLSMEQAREIRHLRATSSMTYRQIAGLYDVSHWTIADICRHKYYREGLRA